MSVYNGLVKLRNMMQEGWSGIDVQLKRRFDLIPNLIETVKGYASHEKETLQNVTLARSAVSSAGNDPEARLQAENALTGTLRTLFAVAESYPDLKANQNFINLQDQLSTIEDAIQMARRYYNGTVRNYNTMIQRFPAVLIARQLGFNEAPFFEAEEESRQTPKVSF
ncbi:MAG: LemA family protein [Synergistaceae bacterium]|nr:LemA family protein [Synergistaceae bacterium]